MHDPATVIAHLSAFLKARGQGVTEQTITNAARYVQLCTAANRRLLQCEEFVANGQVADALKEAQKEPPLAGLFQALDFPERAQWAKVAVARKLPVPPPLDLLGAQALQEALLRAQPPPSVLATPARQTRAETFPAVGEATSGPLASLPSAIRSRGRSLTGKHTLILVAGLIIVVSGVIGAGGAFIGWKLLRVEKAPTSEAMLAKLSTTSRATTTGVKVFPTSAVLKPTKQAPIKLVSGGETPEAPPPPMIRPRDTHVNRYFALPGRSTTEPRKEVLEDVGQVVGLQLVGLDEVANKIEKSQKRLSQTFQGSTLSLKVTVEGGGTEPASLATFQMQNDGNLSFNWSFKANSGAEGQRAADLVRDCVLEVKNNLGEVTYFSFRPIETIKTVVFEPPSVTLEDKKNGVSNQLEYPIVSRPIALPNPPLRLLKLEFDSNRKPTVKCGTNEIRVQKCQPNRDGFEVLIDSQDKNDLAVAGVAADYYYQRFLIIEELASTPAVRGQVVLRVKPRIETMDALEKKREGLVRDSRAQDTKLAQKMKDAKKTEDVKNIKEARDADAKHYQEEIAMVDGELRKWKQDDQQLRRSIKPVVTLPVGVVWMKVADLRVDIYRIVDR